MLSDNTKLIKMMSLESEIESLMNLFGKCQSIEYTLWVPKKNAQLNRNMTLLSINEMADKANTL
jgi:hypothetical protein